MMSAKFLIILAAASVAACGSLLNAGVALVRDGKPLAEIVVAEGALPQVTLAASELRDHVELMTNTALPIVNEPGGELLPIFIGESDHTRKLGIGLDGIDGEGYRVVVTADWLALLGYDKVFPFYPRGFESAADRERLLAEWQEYTGQQWDFPFLQFYDPRNFNPEFGFSLFDPSGSLFAVYDLLEQNGVRWYMPHHDFGSVIPTMNTLQVQQQDTLQQPAFSRRYLRVGWGRDRDTFLWSKRQRLGLTELIWNCHGTSHVTRFTQDTNPEYLAIINGRLQDQTAFGGPGISRLAPPLTEAMIRYADAFLNRYPETPHVSVGPNDGYVNMDDRDREAGWLRSERGPRGQFSDYVWTFINNVAAGLKDKHPDRIVMGLAYSGYRMPPDDIDSLEPNVGVTYCQTRANFYQAGQPQETFAERDQWLDMLPSGEFYVWEYYLWHRPGQQLWGVPVIFWSTLQQDLADLNGKSKGEYVEAWTLQNKQLWGINHMTIYLTAQLYWEPNLDLDALLDEYFSLFYGPAAKPMREFFTFAEEVWMRPNSRTILSDDGFLKEADVDRFFALIQQANDNADPASEYGKRVALIHQEIEPMRDLFAFQDFDSQASQALENGNHSRAAQLLEKAILASSDNRTRANTAFKLGNLYRDQLDSTEDALRAYQIAMDTHIRGAGSAIRSHARMASVDILRHQMRFADAIKLLDDYTGGVRHDYWRVQELRARAAIARDDNQTAKAKDYLQQALAVQGINDSQKNAVQNELDKLTD